MGSGQLSTTGSCSQAPAREDILQSWLHRHFKINVSSVLMVGVGCLLTEITWAVYEAGMSISGFQKGTRVKTRAIVTIGSGSLCHGLLLVS